MKKLLPLLILPIFIYQCSNDNQVSEESSLFTITTSNGYYSENELNTGNPKIFATDENGEIITDEISGNGTTVELKAKYDISSKKYDVTLFKKELNQTSQITRYNFVTYIDVYPYHFEIPNRVDPNPNNEGVSVSIINSSEDLDDFFGATSHSRSNGIYTCGNALRAIPDDFYISFREKTEIFKRYIWIENITGEYNDTIDFSDTEIIDNPTTIPFPTNGSASSVVEGLSPSNPDWWIPLSYKLPITGVTVLCHYIPDNIFTRFKVRNFFETVNESYITIEKSDIINTNYTLPNLEVEVLNNSYNEFQISSPSEFDFYSATFIYELQNEEFSLDWRIYGKKEQTIEYSLPNIFSHISDDFANFDPNNIRLSSVSLYKIQGLDSYDEFICDKLDFLCGAEEQFTIYETYTKKF